MKVVTANRVKDGEVVWLGQNGRWVEACGIAQVFDKSAATDVLASAQSAEGDVVDAYLIDVTIEGGAPMPVRFRERIRAKGPTVRTDLGKQAVPALTEQAA